MNGPLVSLTLDHTDDERLDLSWVVGFFGKVLLGEQTVFKLGMNKVSD
jgi:hypothetical protein